MFQFPPFAYLAVYMSFTHVGCPIRKSPDQWPFAPTRSLSQLITSFFASESQGIRHAPLLTFFMTRFKEPYLSYGASHQQSQSFFKNLLLLLKLSHNMSKIVFSLRARPTFFPSRAFLFSVRPFSGQLVENNGFEPLTLCVQGRCSSQLS